MIMVSGILHWPKEVTVRSVIAMMEETTLFLICNYLYLFNKWQMVGDQKI